MTPEFVELAREAGAAGLSASAFRPHERRRGRGQHQGHQGGQNSSTRAAPRDPGPPHSRRPLCAPSGATRGTAAPPLQSVKG